MDIMNNDDSLLIMQQPERKTMLGDTCIVLFQV